MGNERQSEYKFEKLIELAWTKIRNHKSLPKKIEDSQSLQVEKIVSLFYGFYIQIHSLKKLQFGKIFHYTRY